MSRRAKKIAVGIGVFLFWIAVWEVASLIIAKPVILPSPPAVARALFGLLKTKSFYIACVRSVGLIFIGLAAGTAVVARSTSAFFTKARAMDKRCR